MLFLKFIFQLMLLFVVSMTSLQSMKNLAFSWISTAKRSFFSLKCDILSMFSGKMFGLNDILYKERLN